MSKASAPFLARVTDLFFLFHKAFRPALGPTQPPTEAGPGQLSLGIKQRGCEAYQSPNLMQKLGMSVAISSLPPSTSFHGTYRDDLTQTWLINLNFLYKKQTQKKLSPENTITATRCTINIYKLDSSCYLHITVPCRIIEHKCDFLISFQYHTQFSYKFCNSVLHVAITSVYKHRSL